MTDIITNISASPTGRTRIFVKMSVEAFRTEVIVFIGDVIMCFTSDWPINLRMRVTNWLNIFVDYCQFSDPDFISDTHQRENVHFAENHNYNVMTSWHYDGVTLWRHCKIEDCILQVCSCKETNARIISNHWRIMVAVIFHFLLLL